MLRHIIILSLFIALHLHLVSCGHVPVKVDYETVYETGFIKIEKCEEMVRITMNGYVVKNMTENEFKQFVQIMQTNFPGEQPKKVENTK